MRIDRCVCYDTPFKEVIKRARPEGWTIEDIQRILGCGGGCGMCKPYLREALKTGQTEFDYIIRDASPEP
jgi:bacterioferritin-associated ferredoxin